MKKKEKDFFYSFLFYSHEMSMHKIIASAFNYQTQTWKFNWLETNERNPNVTSKFKTLLKTDMGPI